MYYRVKYSINSGLVLSFLVSPKRKGIRHFQMYRAYINFFDKFLKIFQRYFFWQILKIFSKIFFCLNSILDNLPDEDLRNLIEMHHYLRSMKKKNEETPVKVPWKYFPIWKYQHLISSLTSAGLKDASSNPPAQNKLHKNFLNLIYA